MTDHKNVPQETVETTGGTAANEMRELLASVSGRLLDASESLRGNESNKLKSHSVELVVSRDEGNTLATIRESGGIGREQSIVFDKDGRPTKFSHFEKGNNITINFQDPKPPEVLVNGKPVSGDSGEKLTRTCLDTVKALLADPLLRANKSGPEGRNAFVPIEARADSNESKFKQSEVREPQLIAEYGNDSYSRDFGWLKQFNDGKGSFARIKYDIGPHGQYAMILAAPGGWHHGKRCAQNVGWF